MSKKDKVGLTVGSLRRRCMEKGTIYLFYIRKHFWYVTDLPPRGNAKYILCDEVLTATSPKRTPQWKRGGVLKCFENVFEKYPDGYIGAYTTDAVPNDVRGDIEDFLKCNNISLQ
ncbi:uncharacterized protein METZ01_LOCUS187212 [marine metagenome]|uniref:Uncharacterized protein n=1 Tax=marine metagenome TaxID=408172 RepID=A0A382D7F1_9ZZZZ